MARSSKKQSSMILVVFFFVVAAGLGIAYFSQNKSNNGDVESVVSDGDYSALLVVTKGNATIDRSGDIVTVANNQEEEVLVGDSIKTSSGGRAYVVFMDNSSITLAEDTEIRISDMRVQGGKSVINVEQLLGKTWSRVEQLVDGESADFQLETPNTVAAVRGTQFSCEVKDEKHTVCWAIEHAIELTLKKLSGENKMVVDEGLWFETIDDEVKKNPDLKVLKKKIEKHEEIKGEWGEFNKCLANKARDILKEEGNRINTLVEKKRLYEYCNEQLNGEEDEGDVEGETTEVTEEPQPEEETIPEPTLSKISIKRYEDKLQCTWSGKNVDTYVVVAMDGAGNIVNQREKEHTQHTFKPPKSEKSYLCAVEAKNKTGSVRNTSQKKYYENAQATITEMVPSEGGMMFDQVGGYVNYSNASLSNLEAIVSVRRISDGKYAAKDGSWSSSVAKYFYPIAKVDDTTFKFNSGEDYSWIYNSETSEKVKVSVVIRHTVSRRILTSKQVQADGRLY